jgi:uncharacterized membrane protein (UPF0182 family)
MRIPEPPPEPRRAPRLPRPRAPRIAVLVTIAVVFVLLMSLRGIASIITDYLWFDELGRTDVWGTLLQARFVPALIAGILAFLVVLVSLTVAERLAPAMRFEGPEDEITQRYRSFVAPYAARIRVGIALLVAIAVGANAAAEWRAWLLFRNAVDFNVNDPQFNRDIGFYVFRLPFVNVALGLGFAVLVMAFVLTLVSHYLNGGIRVQNPHQRVTPQVKAHLSVLLALMAIVKTVQYWFARYELVFSRRGTRQGAFYTDVRVQLPAYNLLVIIALIAAGLFVVNIWRRGWALPVIAVGLWGFVSVVVGTIAPALTQKYTVENSELAKERPYLERNIAATRAAFELDAVEVRAFEFDPTLDAADVDASAATLDTARIWDPGALTPQFKEQQGFRGFYTFRDLDVDRYQIGADTTPVILGTRDLNPDELPGGSWLSRHLIYTHGAGVVVAAADESDDSGASYLLSGIPPEGADELRINDDRTGVYYGEGLSGFVVAGSREAEAEARLAGEEGDTGVVRYTGEGGVEVGGFLRKSALALRFWDRNLFLSSSVTPSSRVMWARDPRERVEKIAPFLAVDFDTYPVILDGEIKWIVDAYTTTDRYPYAQSLSLNDRSIGDPRALDSPFNYVRNSVKGVVDAYDGTVTLYAWDEDDPLLRAWRKVFPGLVRDKSEIAPALEAHFRYPEEMFAAQTRQFAEYHVTDAGDFYNASQSWQVASTATEPVTSSDPTVAGGPTETTAAGSASSTQNPMQSLFQMFTLPGEDEPEFALTRSFVPVQRENRLQAIIAGRADPGHAGELVVYEIGGDAASPARASQSIQSDRIISPIITLLNDQGSELAFGEMRVLPIGDSILYIQPFYIRGKGASSFFTLRGVALSDGERAVLADTFDEALADLVDRRQPVDPGDPGDPGDDETVLDLLEEAAQAFADADAAAAQGDYEEQGRLLAEARAKVDEALRLSGETPPTDPTGADGPGTGGTTTTTGETTGTSETTGSADPTTPTLEA